MLRVEKEENVRIFYACESGSRAWGFPSQDSDYDVRFLYLHEPNWYLQIYEGRDVIERPLADSIDLAGWDIKKALKLFRKSNPPLLEWLQSPIVYREDGQVVRKLRSLLPEYYSPVSSLFHYLHMAEGNFREYLKGDQVWVKKYFYMLRPILACKWIQGDFGPVPTEFERLVEKVVVDSDLRAEIDDLLRQKESGDELSWGPRIPVISSFIESELEKLKSQKFGTRLRPPNTEKLDDLFRSSLAEMWPEWRLSSNSN